MIRDDPKQTELAERFIERGAWIPTIALCEAIWVLESAYRREPGELFLAIEGVLQNDRVVIQDAEAVTSALVLFRARPALGFTDCLLLEIARKHGHLPLGTFDKNLAKADGAERI
jgi:predicted nucleic-acid-binding protein